MLNIDNYLQRLNSSIESHFNSNTTELTELAKASVLNGGKRIRGLLCLLACEAVGGDMEDALAVAVGYELYHAAALLQDDIIDCADFRRGEPSAYKKHGLNTALLMSDFLIFEVNEILAKFAGKSDGRKVAALLNTFGGYAKLATLGEYLDIQLGSQQSVQISDYVEMVTYKTSALLTAAAVAGAIVGDASESQLAALREYSDNNGIAYQILDDVLDFTGDPRKIGKPVFNDILGGKKNIVIVHLLLELERLGDSRREDVERLVNGARATTEDRKFLLDLIEEHKSIAFARELASDYSKKAAAAVDGIGSFRAKESFSRLSTYLSTCY